MNEAAAQCYLRKGQTTQQRAVQSAFTTTTTKPTCAILSPSWQHSKGPLPPCLLLHFPSTSKKGESFLPTRAKSPESQTWSTGQRFPCIRCAIHRSQKNPMPKMGLRSVKVVCSTPTSGRADVLGKFFFFCCHLAHFLSVLKLISAAPA